MTVALSDGQRVWAHLPNSGRLEELLVPGRHVLLGPVSRPGRKTSYDLSLVALGQILVSVDARLPNSLVAEALHQGLLCPFQDYDTIRREIRYGESRLDFALEGKGHRCLIEVKSVTLVEAGLALFPDAPTLRGRRHIEELRQAMAAGERCAIIFVVQRDDARAFGPHERADPAFAAALGDAAQAGVEVYAHRCQVTPHEVRLSRPLRVHLAGCEAACSEVSQGRCA